MVAKRYSTEVSPDRGEWDAIIVGTGMGGATLGFAFERAGWRVLFLEKGTYRQRIFASHFPLIQVTRTVEKMLRPPEGGRLPLPTAPNVETAS